MTSRVESAAKTRRALLDAASELLDAGGPEAVTLREVGTLAGVSRAAPYRHFADKDGLLTAVSVESWERMADALRTNGAIDAAPSEQLQDALMAFVELGRERPHLYQLMFVISKSDPGAGGRAASRAQDEFLSIVAATGRRGGCTALRRLAVQRRTRYCRAGDQRASDRGEVADNRRRPHCHLGEHDERPLPGDERAIRRLCQATTSHDAECEGGSGRGVARPVGPGIFERAMWPLLEGHSSSVRWSCG